MKFITLLLPYNLAFVSSFSIQHDMKMIRDVLVSYEMPLTIHTLLSWPKAEKQRFGRIMLRERTSLAFLHDNIQSRPLISDNKILFVIDLEHGSALEYLKYANATGILAYPNHWLVIDKNSDDPAIVPAVMNRFKILPNSEVIIARRISNNSYDLHLIYKIQQDREWILEYFGRWTVTNGFEISQYWNTVTAIRRKNLRGEPLVTAAVLSANDSSTELRSLKDVVTEQYHKATFYQLFHVYEFLNITRTLKFYNAWSSIGNPTTGGMIGALVHGDAQLAGSMVLFLRERLEVLDYISQPIAASIVFVFREPRLSYQNNLFLLPFQLSVWLSIFGFTLIFIIILYITAKWEQIISDANAMSRDPNLLRSSISDIAIVAISAITQQGTPTELKGGRGRVVIFLLFLSFLFLYTSYSASIVVLLQSSSSQIRTLQDLLNSKLELGVENTTYNKNIFVTATEPVRKAIYEKKIAPPGAKPNYLSLWDGVKKLQTEPFAFNMYAPMGYRMIRALFQEHEKCGLREIAYVKDNELWYTCKKNSPYRELYKLALCRMSEHGLIGRWNKIFFSEKPPCILRGGAFVSVQIIDFYPALLFLMYGMFCSVILLILEIFVHNRTKQSLLTEE